MRSALAEPVRIPATGAARRHAPSAFLPDNPDPALFQQLARVAMDAARGAGAEFADIRIGAARALRVAPLPSGATVELLVSYGIRARVQGTWGFQYGSVLTTDAVVATARSAVEGATRYAATNRVLGTQRITALAPAPRVQGEWRAPVIVDPFTVSLDDHYRMLASLTESTAPVYRNRPVTDGGFAWDAETRVFASTDDSLVTQYFMKGGHGVWGGARMPDHPTDFPTVLRPNALEASGGFELVTRPGLVDDVLAGMDEVTRLRELRVRPFLDVGRFPVVFDGTTFASLVGETLGLALDAERALGLEADASGTTFLTPPLDIVAAPEPACSPLLTITSDRKLPSSMAAGWDDEGVAPEPYTLIDRGHVVDYHTTRETAPALAEWYARRGRPLRSHGGTVATRPTSVPTSAFGMLRVAPATSPMTVYDLAKEISHGFIVRGGMSRAEAGLSLATVYGMMVEIQNGKPVARTDVTLKCATKATFQKNLLALGDATTVLPSVVRTPKGIPWEEVTSFINAPAALCRDVDIISLTLRAEQ